MIKLSWKNSASRLALSRFAHQFCSDERGSTMPIYAGGLLLLATAAGAVLSVNERTAVMTELQAASDAAALAATNTFADLKTNQATNGLSDSQIASKAIETAKAIYKINNSGSDIPLDTSKIELNVVHDAAGKAKGISVKLTPSGQTPVFLGGFLDDSFKLTASVKSEAYRGIGRGTSVYRGADARNLEIVLVLDITGSMGSTLPGESQSKIVGLRNAVKAFVNAVYGEDIGSTESPPSNIKIGIIPYSNTVNVGKLLNGSELQVPADLSGWTSRNDSKGWKGCIVERSTTPNLVALDPVGTVTIRADALDVRDAAQAVTPEKWTPYYNEAIEFYQRDPGNSAKGLGRQTSNWFKPSDYSSARPPLRVVRTNVSEYWRRDTTTGAGEARDGSGNTVPRLTESTAPTGSGSPNSGCVPQALGLDSGRTKKQIADYVDGLSAGGWTHSNLGMAWANRMLSPWAPLTGAKNYGDAKTDKLIVLMTDGYITAGDIYGQTTNANSTSVSNLLKSSSVQNPAGFFKVDDDSSYDGTQMSWAGYYYSYGLSLDNRLVGTRAADGKPNSNASGHILAHQQRLLMACKAARTPEGYSSATPATKVYTILFGFNIPNGSRNIYEECATVPGYALTADKSSELIEAFTKIADDSKLQLTE
jgi:hypothetical protein